MVVVLNNWKRERNNAGDVIDLLIGELDLRKKWEVPD